MFFSKKKQVKKIFKITSKEPEQLDHKKLKSQVRRVQNQVEDNKLHQMSVESILSLECTYIKKFMDSKPLISKYDPNITNREWCKDYGRVKGFDTSLKVWMILNGYIDTLLQDTPEFHLKADHNWYKAKDFVETARKIKFVIHLRGKLSPMAKALTKFVFYKPENDPQRDHLWGKKKNKEFSYLYWFIWEQLIKFKNEEIYYFISKHVSHCDCYNQAKAGKIDGYSENENFKALQTHWASFLK